VCLVLIKTDIVRQFLIQRVKEFKRIKHECQRQKAKEGRKKERTKANKDTMETARNHNKERMNK
jgi:phage regulator Rha-like protein